MFHVLLVHPDGSVRDALARALRAADFRVTAVDPADDAVGAVVDVMVAGGPAVDERLIDICRRRRARPEESGVPLLAFAAGAARPEERRRVMTAGADVFLEAPAGQDIVVQLHALIRVSRLAEAAQIRRQLEAVFDAMSDGVAVFDAAGKLVLMNDAQARINGFASREDMLRGLDIYTRVYELRTLEGAVLPVEQWPVTRVMRGESLHRLELRGLRRDTGQSWYFEYSGQPVRGPGGRQVLSIIITRDMTREKIIEERLIEAKEIAERHRVEQEAIFSSMTEGLVVFDRQGNLLDMNPAALAIHRFKSVEAVRMHLGQFPSLNVLCDFNGDPLPLEQWPISRALCGETFSNYEVQVIPTDGSEPWIGSYGGAPVVGADGEMILAIVTLRDITAQKRAEAQLLLKEAALAQANLELERKVEERTAELREIVGELEHFSYTLTHDLRAPLRAMHAFGDLLNERYASNMDTTGRDYLRRIVHSAGRMDLLITDALDYSKIMRSEYPLQPLEPGPLLREIVESYPELQPPQAEIVVMEPLPAVQANRAGLTQCFANLLTNAVKFVPAGVVPRVVVRAEDRDGRVRLWFEDNGIGIPAEQRERIFGMFERLSTRYPGTGVGLALVRKVVTRMHGSVGVESNSSGGSRFWLEFAKPAPTD